MKNKKGNVAVVAIIIVIVAITAGILGWMFARKSQIPAQQQQPEVTKPAAQTQTMTQSVTPEIPAKKEFSISAFEPRDNKGKASQTFNSGAAVSFYWQADGAVKCEISGAPLFKQIYATDLAEGSVSKAVNDFSSGTYTLKCKNEELSTKNRDVTLNVIPKNKLVMCLNSCGSRGELVPATMLRHPGETVQKIRACFGSFSSNCPSQDVTKSAGWSTSDSAVIVWSKDFTVDGKKIADDVYPNKTLKVNYMGNAKAMVQYQGYFYSVQVDSQQVQ